MNELSRKILSDITVYAKYAKYLPSLKRRETWEDLTLRNYAMHIIKYPHLTDEIRNIYLSVLEKEVFPSMRALQFSGKPIEICPSRIYNCSFAAIDHPAAFSEAMFLLLGGTGFGFSVQKFHVEKLPELSGPKNKKRRYLVSDSIEGWADAVKILMESYFHNKSEPEYDFRDIRPKGAQLITSGGKAPGPQPLKDCLHNIKKVLDNAITERGVGTQLKPIEAHDTICYIADAVLAGGIRRAACISIFSFDDDEMVSSKIGAWWELNPQRARANNSASILRHKITEKEFKEYFWRMKASGCGEPGIFLTSDKTLGINPCSEISLKSNSFCNLTTINGADIKTQEELNRRAKYASFIGTLQAGYTDFHYLRPIWRKTTEEESLLGISITGIATKTLLNLNFEEAAKIAVAENKRVAKLIGIKPAKRLTCVKPEGCQKKETMVSTKEGILHLEEIGNIDSEVIWQNHDYNVYTDSTSKKSTRFYQNGVAKTKKILTDGGIELEATHNHMYRILTDDNRYIWKRSDEIEEGDMLPYSIGEYDGGSYQNLIQIEKNQCNVKVIKQPTILTEELAWFLGIYFGDGSNHDKGIRIHGNYYEKKGFDKLGVVVNNLFDLSINEIRHSANDGRTSIYINSTMLNAFLGANGLLKEKSKHINIPQLIRKSPKSVIEAFIDGYATADGCDKSVRGRLYCTTSKKMAEQLVVVLRAIGIDCKMRLMPPTDSSFGNNMRYFIQERKGRTGNISKTRKYLKDAYNALDNLGYNNLSVDRVVSISDGECYTCDIEVDDEEHTYISGSYISHNTASLVAGTSAGIHAWHAPYYIRRIRLGKDEALYRYLSESIPDLLEDEYFNPKNQSVLSIPVKSPDDAILRDEGAISLLERSKKITNEWITPGHINGQNKHNVSITISVKDDEWDNVCDWLWDNRSTYTGISVLPYDGGTYIQAPFQDCTKEEYENLLSKVKDIDLSKIVEIQDTTDLQGELACSGGNCQITNL